MWTKPLAVITQPVSLLFCFVDIGKVDEKNVLSPPKLPLHKLKKE